MMAAEAAEKRVLSGATGGATRRLGEEITKQAQRSEEGENAGVENSGLAAMKTKRDRQQAHSDQGRVRGAQ